MKSRPQHLRDQPADVNRWLSGGAPARARGAAERAASLRRWSQARNVLCVRLDALGDVLMSEPAMRALAESAEGRRLTLLTSPAAAAASSLLPALSEVITYDAPWMPARAPAPEIARDVADDPTEGAHAGADLEMVATLRSRRFDAAVIFTVYSQSALPAAMLCTLAGIPLRLAHCRERPYRLLSDWLPDPEPHALLRHEVRRQLDLVASVGCRAGEEPIRVRVPERARVRVGSLLEELELADSRRWVVVHAGGSAAARRYPPELLARACHALVREHGVPVLMTGDESDVPLVEEVRIRMQAPSTSLAGRLSLEELAALLEAAPLLVSGNTGPVHLAAALGTPVVVTYALTNPQHTPWQVPSIVLAHDVPCRWCYSSVCPEGHHACLRQVRPEALVGATLRLLEDRAAGEPVSWLMALDAR